MSEYLDFTGLAHYDEKIKKYIDDKIAEALSGGSGGSGSDCECTPIDTAFINTLLEHYDYVDFGLPSGNLWATKNLGAADELHDGLYFKFGGDTGYVRYNPIATNYFNGTSIPIADCVDAATSIVGSDVYTPTKEDFEELMGYTNHTRVAITIDGSSRYVSKFTSKTDSSKYIIIPNSGYYSGSTIQFVDGTNTFNLNTKSRLGNGNNCYGFILNSSGNIAIVSTNTTSNGYNIRPIKKV